MTCPCRGYSGWYMAERPRKPGERFRYERVECPCGAAERERRRLADADDERLKATWDAEERRKA